MNLVGAASVPNRKLDGVWVRKQKECREPQLLWPLQGYEDERQALCLSDLGENLEHDLMRREDWALRVESGGKQVYVGETPSRKDTERSLDGESNPREKT